ncbi:hypothetical protein PybrP1_001173 [[Pythium] brassicae (nom. inval.)]|nr:hypothetical protein PybrP1_001173 [[Pythium] brassicae (nom. inval.)]
MCASEAVAFVLPGFPTAAAPLSPPLRALRARADDAAGAAARERRKLEAEKILEEIAREYAAKRAAGLVPSVPVPARTLLWEELERSERSRVGRRGQCVFGRDTDAICGCLHYRRKKLKGQSNPGGVCESCDHGGPWHRLTGGTMTQRTSNGYTRSFAGSSVRASHLGSMARSDVPSQRSLASAQSPSPVAYPHPHYAHPLPPPHHPQPYAHYQHQHQHPHPPPAAAYPTPYSQYHHHTAPSPAASDGDLRDDLLRSSMLSSGSSSLGLPPRNSSGAPQLDALLRAINRYRRQGFSEDEVEQRIAVEFPPAPRRASTRLSYASGELASI